jgi:hypothetical protein
MKPETKLWLRKKTLMVLRAIVWHVDEWLHRQEVALRNDLCGRKTCIETAASVSERPISSGHASPTKTGRPQGETVLQWEARKSGIAVISKKDARRRRERPTSTAFDRRFA